MEITPRMMAYGLMGFSLLACIVSCVIAHRSLEKNHREPNAGTVGAGILAVWFFIMFAAMSLNVMIKFIDHL